MTGGGPWSTDPTSSVNERPPWTPVIFKARGPRLTNPNRGQFWYLQSEIPRSGTAVPFVQSRHTFGWSLFMRSCSRSTRIWNVSPTESTSTYSGVQQSSRSIRGPELVCRSSFTFPRDAPDRHSPRGPTYLGHLA